MRNLGRNNTLREGCGGNLPEDDGDHSHNWSFVGEEVSMQEWVIDPVTGYCARTLEELLSGVKSAEVEKIRARVVIARETVACDVEEYPSEKLDDMAVREMNVVLRSMLSRGEAYAKAKELMRTAWYLARGLKN